MEIKLDRPSLSGTFRTVASKSEAHRALICAALSDTPSYIQSHGSECADITATVEAIHAIGGRVERTGSGYFVTPFKPMESARFDCGESGATLRFMLPVAAAICGDLTLDLHGKLPERPISPLKEQMKAHGAVITGVNPLKCTGIMMGGDFSLDGGVSSQFVSGLLMALTRIGGSIRITGMSVSKPYIFMTLDILRRYGASIDEIDKSDESDKIDEGGKSHESDKSGESGCMYKIIKKALHAPNLFTVGGDWSDAAAFITAGAIGRNPITVTGLSTDTEQGDSAIVGMLRGIGGHIECTSDSITAYPSKLHGSVIDISHTPDLAPILAVAASAASGSTRIVNAGRLRLKESDRIKSIYAMISGLGGEISVTGDSLTITGAPLLGGRVDSFGDHRIAMSAAIASTLCESAVIIDGCESADKSHPSFWEDFRRLCV